MIEKELAHADTANLHSPKYVSMRIRLVHHRMFFCAVEPLWMEMLHLLNSLPTEIDSQRHGEVLFMLGGNLGTLRGLFPQARQYLYQAIRLGLQHEDDYLVCRSLRKLSDYLRHDGHFFFALRAWEIAWSISERRLHTRQGIYLLCCRGDLERQMGKFSTSHEYFRNAMASAQDAHVPGWIAHCYLGLAELAMEQGDLPASESNLGRAKSMYEQIGQSWGLVQVRILVARQKLLYGDREWKVAALEALEESRSLGYNWDELFLRRILETNRIQGNCLMFL